MHKALPMQQFPTQGRPPIDPPGTSSDGYTQLVMPPSATNGKVCYLEIPTNDVARSADFYSKAFGWKIRADNSGSIAFDDPKGNVSGLWVLGRTPSLTPGVLVSIMVDDAAATLETIVELGGSVVQPIPSGATEIFAHFRDPADNVFCIYQHNAG